MSHSKWPCVQEATHLWSMVTFVFLDSLAPRSYSLRISKARKVRCLNVNLYA